MLCIFYPKNQIFFFFLLFFLFLDDRESPNGDAEAESITVKAHKYVLVSRSPVFMHMFYGAVAHTGEEVQINDADPKAFHSVVRWGQLTLIWYTIEIMR